MAPYSKGTLFKWHLIQMAPYSNGALFKGEMIQCLSLAVFILVQTNWTPREAIENSYLVYVRKKRTGLKGL